MPWLPTALAVILTSVPVAALVTALYNTYLKQQETAVDGWHFTTSPGFFVTNGEQDVDLTIRCMGPATVYEVDVQAWGDLVLPPKYQDSIPKMSCDSDPIKLTLKHPVPVPEGKAFWAGVTWTEASRWGVRERGARINIATNEYQRWYWQSFRNAFRLWREPKGSWRTVQPRKGRKRYSIPRADKPEVAGPTTPAPLTRG